MPRPRQYASDAEKQKAYRERNDLVNLCVQLPASLVNEFEAWLKFKDKTKAEVIEKLLRSQLLRKR
ncbi:MAG: hypothetical protein WA071_17590 [Undibacterium umbellatum]|uniref:hypothetical protein n=1 Tax=Undibacterium umbellatum TaxID=2762300 RepID=UPI003BB6053F